MDCLSYQSLFPNGMYLKISLSVFLLLYSISFTLAQTDTLKLSNNDLMIGEIKSMDKGILGFETDYSDTDFKIKWAEIKRISSKSNFLITLEDGRRFNGKIRSLNDSIVEIDTYLPEVLLKFSKRTEKLEKPQGNRIEISRVQIVYLNVLDEGFWSRLSLNFDVGINFTKANDLRQYTFNAGLGYLADRWKANMTFNNLRSTQTDADPIKRTELTSNFNYFLPNDWFALYNINTLSNTQQLLNLRVSNIIGIGKYFVHSNKSYLGFQAGLNLNNEKFQGDENASQSGELMFGGQYNIYDIGDLDLLTSLAMYPSFTQKGRFRTDFKFDIRYEFKIDLYFKVGTTLNYDNQPASGASSTDYIFQTTVGWKL